MALATLSIDLEAKLANLEAGMDKAARLAEKNAQATQAAWSRAGAGLAAIGASAAAAFAGFSLVDFVRSNVDAIDKLNDVADATGASIENISALEDLAKRTGTTLDVVSTSLIRLNKELSDTSPKSEAAQALAAIGLNAAELRSQDPAEALRRVAVALSGFANDANKARLVQELFGKSIAEVAPFLNDLAEKTQLVGTTTAAQAAAAEKFNKQLFDLAANADLARRAFVSDLLPSLNRLLTEFRTGIEVFGGFKEALLNVGLSNPFENIGDRVAKLAKLREELQRVEEQSKNAKTRTEQLASEDRRKSLQAEIDAAAKLVEYYKRVQVLNAPQADYSNEGRVKAPDTPSVNFDPKKQGAPKAEQISEAQRALASYIAELQKELEKTEAISEQQKALNLLKSLGTTGQVQQVQELVLGLERQITLSKQEAAIRADILRVTKEQESEQRSLEEEIYRLSGRADEGRKIALTKVLEDQLNAGVKYSPEELAKITNGIGGVTQSAKDKLDELDELTKQFGRNVQDLLGDTLKRSLKGDFDDIGKAWGDLLLSMIAQAGALQVGKALFGDFFKTGDLGGGIGSLFSAFQSGGGLAGLFKFIPGFATGGDFSGGLRIVGENGPELEATGPARIFNADQTQQILRGGRGGLQLTYAPMYQVDSRSDRGQLLADIEAANQRHQGELMKFLRAKGVI
ncbi:hypothetical protein WDZ92_27645 [Nostoc sp. NIES-2111]